MADLKTQPTKQSVTAFLKTVEPQRRADAKLLMPIMRRVTTKRPTMWGASIIGYGKYHYTYKSGREGDWFITGFSPNKSRLSIHVLPHLEPHAALLKKLGKHTHGVSCLYVNRLEDIDLSVLEDLLTRGAETIRRIYPDA